MPIPYEIDHNRRLVVAKPHGVMTDTEVFEYQQQAWSRPDTCGYNELIDMTAVTRIELVSGDRVTELAKLSSSMDPPALSSKLAIIARSDFHFGLARMYQARRETAAQSTKEVRVYRSRREALEWLGVEPTQ